MEPLGYHWKDFHGSWYSSICRKSVEKVQVLLKSDKNKGYFTWRPVYIYENILLKYFVIRNISDKTCRKYENTHFVFNNVFPKIVPFFWDNLEIYGRARQPKDGNIIGRVRNAFSINKATHTHTRARAHTHTTHTHKHTHTKCNNCCFTTAKKWLPERALMFRWYLCCLSCLKSELWVRFSENPRCKKKKKLAWCYISDQFSHMRKILINQWVSRSV